MTGMEFGVAVCEDCGEQRWAGTGPCTNCIPLAPDSAADDTGAAHNQPEGVQERSVASTSPSAPSGASPTPYDSRTPSEVVHDFVMVRGDLSEQYARDQLIRWIERYASNHTATPNADDTPPPAAGEVTLTEDERATLGTWLRHRGVYSFGLLCDIADCVDRILAARLKADRAAREVAAKAEALREAAEVIPGHFPVGEGPRDWLRRRADRFEARP